MITLEERLRHAETEVSRLKSLIAQEPYPVGTVLMRRAFTGTILAYRLASVHVTQADCMRPVSDAPVWVTVWNDFSGRTYASFDALNEAFSSRPGNWQELYVPGRDKS